MKLKPQIAYDIVIFTEMNALVDYLVKTEVEVFITSESSLVNQKNNWKINNFIWLDENKVNENSKNIKEYKSIFRYQSTDIIIKEILSYCNQKSDEYTTNENKYKGKIIGIYSPIGRCGKTHFSLALSQMLGKNGRVLYLNLEEYSGLSQSLLCSKELTLSDILYLYRRLSSGIINRISEAICQTGSFDYIPPAQYPEDLADVLTVEWTKFCKYIMEYLEYDYLIIDVGNLIKEPTNIMGIMDEVFVPYADNNISNEKIKEFSENLKNTGKVNIHNKMIMIQIPEDEEFMDETFLTEKIEWSKLGRFTRKVINERSL